MSYLSENFKLSLEQNHQSQIFLKVDEKSKIDHEYEIFSQFYYYMLVSGAKQQCTKNFLLLRRKGSKQNLKQQ